MKESTMKKTEAVQKTGNVLIRVITLPPLMAALALCILRWQAGFFPATACGQAFSF